MYCDHITKNGHDRFISNEIGFSYPTVLATKKVVPI